MAIFGFQLCFTIIMASFLQKLTPIYSLGRWILCGGGLYRFLYPSNEELKKLAGKESSEKRSNNKKESKNSAKKRNQGKGATEKSSKTKEVFKIPKNVNIPLDSSDITPLDALILRKYDEFEWLVDYGLYATIVYCGTEVYYEWWKPAPEFNISMVWAMLAIGFVCKNLFSILFMYYKAATGELSTSIVFGFFSFVAAMAVLVVDEETLEFGLDSAYEAMAQNASLLSFGATVYPSPAPTPLPLPIIKVGVAIICGIIGALLTFPGIRTSQMYVDGLKYSKSNQLMQLLLHINFATPFFICFMWVKPLARDVLCGQRGSETSTRKPFLAEQQFDVIRLVVIFCLCLLKIVAIRTHLQAFLNLACIKIRNLRREAGQTTNIDVQQTVARNFSYLCIIALQYIGPVMGVIFLTMCLKTMGGYSWNQIRPDYVMNSTHATVQLHTNTVDEEATFSEMVSHAGLSLARVSAVFTPMVFRSIFSFLIWWLCASWFLASCMGIVYHRFLNVY